MSALSTPPAGAQAERIDGIPAGPWLLKPLMFTQFGYDTNPFYEGPEADTDPEASARYALGLTGILPFRESALRFAYRRDRLDYENTKLTEDTAEDFSGELLLRFPTHDEVTVGADLTRGIADTLRFDPGGKAMADFWVFIKKVSKPHDLGMKIGYICEVVPVNHPLLDHERAMYIIVPVTGVTQNEVGRLTALQWSNGSDSIPLGVDPPPTLVAKRKHQVRFADMQIIVSGFDMQAATNPSVIYQPFIDRNIKVAIKSINAVWDKHTGTYRRTF